MAKSAKKPSRRYKDLDQETTTVEVLQTPSSTPSEPNKEKEVKKELRSLGGALSKLGKHFVITLCVTGLAVLMHLVLVYWFRDPKFFDLIPVRYAIDVGDIAVIITFFVIMIRELWKQEK